MPPIRLHWKWSVMVADPAAADDRLYAWMASEDLARDAARRLNRLEVVSSGRKAGGGLKLYYALHRRDAKQAERARKRRRKAST